MRGTKRRPSRFEREEDSKTSFQLATSSNRLLSLPPISAIISTPRHISKLPPMHVHPPK
ncbi:hypothetical protein PHMEG_00030729 [Phytophthora megakarya]|uniref:Uncharacterized protein n=1 Tax=Phytophthora megakarya TaxID=4795 RepID=A0A225UZV6_9STRA|nr:hypothetical protein PHMEG_00030727 [Phytophthora megakarya]OWY98496.1 hypothetical protein PHMEG_00030729 [Phytophthora megakarya]